MMGTEQEEGKRESGNRGRSKAKSWCVEKRVLGKLGFDGETGVGMEANETDVEVEDKARTQAEPLSLRLALSGSNICNPIIWETKARGLNL